MRPIGLIPALVCLCGWAESGWAQQPPHLTVERAQGAEPEDPDEYRGVNIFWVPPEARWAYLKSMAAADHRSARRRHHERDNAALGLVADLVTYLAKAMIR